MAIGYETEDGDCLSTLDFSVGGRGLHGLQI